MRRSSSLARLAALLCLCLGISALENLLLSAVPIPVPGVKLGLSNLVILFSLTYEKPSAAWILMLSRCTISALLFGNVSTLWFSLLGGVCSVLVMQASIPLTRHGFSYFSVSIIGSIGFQIGQGIAAVLLYGFAILYWIPLLFLCGIFTGALLGICMNLMDRRFAKLKVKTE